MIPSYGPYIHNVTFRNITTYGHTKYDESRGNVWLHGLSRGNDVSGITFDDVVYYDHRITAESPYVHINDYVDGISFIEK